MFVEVEGRAEDVDRFEVRLVAEAPPLARIDRRSSRHGDRLRSARPRLPYRREPDRRRPAKTFVSPDVAVCDDCLAELFDPADRRYRYPFINCTNCGPRFTITVRLPYDRPNTTMGGFALCADCAAEYHDPHDRRFHAQPVACAECGPRIWFEPVAGGSVEGPTRPSGAAQAALGRGEIVAIKGLGGYHLACDATSDRGGRRAARAASTGRTSRSP